MHPKIKSVLASTLICASATCTSTALHNRDQAQSRKDSPQTVEQTQSKEAAPQTTEQFQHRQTEVCPQLSNAGAEKVAVVIVDDNNVLLIGTKGNDVVWKKSFPLQHEINSAKAVVTCTDHSVEVSSQAPYSAAISTQTFSWDGQNLKPISGPKQQDSSAQTVEEAIKAAERGDSAQLKSIDLDSMLYPQQYTNKPTLTAALRRGHRAATALYKAQKPREAAERLSLMFGLTVKLSNAATGDNNPPDSLDSWLKAWKSQEVEPRDYIQILGDYGYFLQQAGSNEAAIPVFETVINESPSYAAAYLNLADSLWNTGRRAEAKQNYTKYQQLTSREGKGQQMPLRVLERAK